MMTNAQSQPTRPNSAYIDMYAHTQNSFIIICKIFKKQ